MTKLIMILLAKQTLRIFSLSWSEAVQYRGDLALWTIASTLAPLISLAVWYTVATSGQSGVSPQDMLTYYILIMLIEYVTRSWRGVYMAQEILDGSIVRYLLRPPIFFIEHLTETIATKIFQLALPLLLFATALIALPDLFSPQIFERSNLLLGLLSIAIAFLVSSAVDYCVGLLAFWIEEVQELHSYRFLLMEVASGVLIPFAVMPDALFTLFSLLPFRYMVSAPAEILLGQATGEQALTLIGIQLAWSVGLIVLVRVLWIFGLRRYAIPAQ